MNKFDLLEIIQRLLRTDTDLEFLTQLSESQLETLAACIRERVEQGM